jgi:hypothetical protein
VSASTSMARCSLNSVRASKSGEVNVSITLSRLYDDYAAATEVLRELESIGIPASEISIVASNADNWYSGKGTTSSESKHDHNRDGVDDRSEGAATGAGIGATVGGIAGLLAGLGDCCNSRNWSCCRSRVACLHGSHRRGRRRCGRHPRSFYRSRRARGGCASLRRGSPPRRDPPYRPRSRNRSRAGRSDS